jgi:hypothetical protein
LRLRVIERRSRVIGEPLDPRLAAMRRLNETRSLLKQSKSLYRATI